MKHIKKNDALILTVLLALAIIIAVFYWVFFSGDEAVAEIYHGSNLIKIVDLDEKIKKTDDVISITDNVKLLVSNGVIRFFESSCRDKICINSGQLSIAGQGAACLPNQVIIKIVPKNLKKSKLEHDIIV